MKKVKLLRVTNAKNILIGLTSRKGIIIEINPYNEHHEFYYEKI